MKKKYLLSGGMAVVLGSAFALLNTDNESPGPHAFEATSAESMAPTMASTIIPSNTISASSNRKSGSTAPDNQPPPIPEPVNQPPSQSSHVQLWQVPAGDSSTMVDEVPATRLQVDPADLREFHVGQTLVLDIPDGDMIEAEITSTHNDPTGVHVWEGDIAGARNEAAVIISQGKTQTHMIIASENGSYSVVIDNQTGETTLVDEGHIKELQAPIDDGIVVGPPEEIPLPVIN